MAATEVEAAAGTRVTAATARRKILKGFDGLPKTIASIREFSAAKGILVFLVGGLLYAGHMAFVPIALALLMALIDTRQVTPEALARASRLLKEREK